MGLSEWVEVHAGASAEVSAQWRQPITILFIDGDHSYDATAADFKAWAPFVVHHGLVIFHDVQVWPGVTSFYTQLKEDRQHWRRLFQLDTMAVLQRTGT